MNEPEAGAGSSSIEAHGFGMVLATPKGPDAAMRPLMSRMKAMTVCAPGGSRERKVLPQQEVGMEE